MNAFFIAPAISGAVADDPDLDPPLAGAAPRAARPDPGRARPPDGLTVMGFWDVLRGRTPPEPANLDSLFVVPSAAITLQTALGLRPTGVGVGLLPGRRGRGVRADPGRRRRRCSTPTPRRPTSRSRATGSASPGSVAPRPGRHRRRSCTDLHAVNTTLEAQGFGPGLLCSLVPFARRDRAPSVGLVYLYKQGTFYPFAPTGPEPRDNLLELQVRDHLARRAADGAGPAPLDGRLGRSGPVSRAPRRRRVRVATLERYDVLAPSQPRVAEIAAHARSTCARLGVADVPPMAEPCNLLTDTEQHQVADRRLRRRRSARARTRCAPRVRRGRRAGRAYPTPARTSGSATNPFVTGDARRRPLLRLPPAGDAATGVRSAPSASSTRAAAPRRRPGAGALDPGRPGRRRARARAAQPRARAHRRRAQAAQARAGALQRAAGGLRRPGQPRPPEPAHRLSSCRWG